MTATPTSPNPETPRDVILRALAECYLQPDPHDVRVRLCLALRELFGADRAWLAGKSLAYDPEVPALSPPDLLTYADSLADGAAAPVSPWRETLLPALGAQAAEAPGPVLLARPANATGAAAKVLAALGAAAILVRPLRVRGALWGHLAAADAAGFEPSADALAAFETFAAAVEGLLGHMAVEERHALSRELSAQIIEDMPVAVFAVDEKHRIVKINSHTARLAGMDKERILREGCFGLLCDKKTHYEKCPGHASLHTGAPWDGEVDLDGRHYRVAVRPIRIEDRTPYSLVTLDDCTEEYRHKRLLDSTVARLVRRLTQADRVRECLTRLATIHNAAEVRDLAVREAAELLGAAGAYLVRDLPDGRSETVFKLLRTPGAEQIFEQSLARAPLGCLVRDRGELVHVHGSETGGFGPGIDAFLDSLGCNRLLIQALRTAEGVWGRIGFAVASSGDSPTDDLDMLHEAAALVQISIRRGQLIDEVDRKEASLVAALEKAEAAARAKTMFLATMSHEIRTPLNAVIGFSETLGRVRNPPPPPEAVECIEGIDRSANALLDLLNDVLDFSKLESGTDVGMFRGECDLPALFREMEVVFRYTARAKGIELRHAVPDGFPRLRLSGQRMRQLLLNLVGNAVKFTEKGFVEWTASFEPAGEGAVSLAIDVRDTGIGISRRDLETIFEPFVQGGVIRPDARTAKGTGLGLPIVRRLVDACGGTIRVESELGKGSVFRILVGHVETVDAPSAAPAAAAPEGPARPPALPDGFLPLLVDDIALNLHILSLHLRNIGVRETLQAESGEKALEAMRARRPSAVFTDIWMPGMDGAALARAIRGDPAFAGVPVVAVTADSDTAASFDVSVFDDILVKPISTDKVSECLARLFPPA